MFQAPKLSHFRISVELFSTDDKRGKIHIDTSIQIEQFKEEKRAAPVRVALRRFSFRSTSSYARREFKAAWLRDLGFLYEVARTATRYEDILREINRRLGAPIQRRRLARCHEAIVAFLSRQSGDLPLGALVTRYRAHLRESILGAYTEWDRSIHHEFCGTGCIRATERPKMDANGDIDVSVPRCKQGRGRCRIAVFFEENKEAFARLADAIDAAIAPNSKDVPYEFQELSKARDTIRLAQRNPQNLLSDVACCKIGDVLIAVDGLQAADCYAANNPKEWELIASVLGKQLINPARGTSRECNG